MLRRIMIIVGGVFLPVGIVLLAVCAFTTVGSLHFKAAATSTTGTVVDVESRQSCSDNHCRTDYFPVVSYRTADGKNISFTSNAGSSFRPRIGDHVTVLYQRNNPERARLDSFTAFWVAPLVTGGVGVLFTAVGALMITLWVRRRQLDAWLEANGTRIMAEVVRIARNPNVSINRVHPWQVLADWADPSTGLHHTFRSDDLRDDPSARLGGRRNVEVLIDPADPGRRYRMLLDSAGTIS